MMPHMENEVIRRLILIHRQEGCDGATETRTSVVIMSKRSRVMVAQSVWTHCAHDDSFLINIPTRDPNA